jgi:acyl-CoA reductase-like NAD-dependent aldehyde dehydrogenase
VTVSASLRDRKPTQHFINGTWTSSGDRTFATRNPFDGEVVAEVAAGGRAESVAAVEAAAQAFPGWSEELPMERQRLFLKAADIMERRKAETVDLLARETGAGSIFGASQVEWSVRLLRQAANWGYLPKGDVLASDTRGRLAMAVRKPLGVVAGLTPWNGAVSLAWRTIALPMAFGNTVVIKPSEEAPLTAGLLHAEIMEEAGFPPGSINVVTHAPGDAAAVADFFFESRAVRCLNFTGSDRTGRMLAERAGRALKPIVLELGGYNPLLVLDDAPLEAAVEAAVYGAFIHQGQVCMCTRKVYVDQTIHDDFLELVRVKVQALRTGDPRDPSTIIGPLINDHAVGQIDDRVKEAVASGAELVTGGQQLGNNIYQPTVLANVPPEAAAANGCEETFGPLLVVEAVDCAETAMQRAQDTPFGLSAGIITGDQERGLELALRFDTGIVHVNSATVVSEPSLPNGGVKDSGWGRSGPYAMEDFTELRLTTLNSGPMQFPF